MVLVYVVFIFCGLLAVQHPHQVRTGDPDLHLKTTFTFPQLVLELHYCFFYSFPTSNCVPVWPDLFEFQRFANFIYFHNFVQYVGFHDSAQFPKALIVGELPSLILIGSFNNNLLILLLLDDIIQEPLESISVFAEDQLLQIVEHRLFEPLINVKAHKVFFEILEAQSSEVELFESPSEVLIMLVELGDAHFQILRIIALQHFFNHKLPLLQDGLLFFKLMPVESGLHDFEALRKA